MPRLRCDKTTLFKNECDHCRNPQVDRRPKPKPQPRTFKSEFSREFPAGFDSDCGECFGMISEGDMIRMGPNGATCEDCYRDS